MVCAQLVPTGHSGWKGSATVAVNGCRDGSAGATAAEAMTAAAEAEKRRASTGLALATAPAETSLREGDMK